ncbi:DUF4238 domain-containing protein [Tritonibacter mobilis]|uniref:DUF4238 domain-containing protein n=1 Tax=Tritonibacter mobilis TaxID=379347 RepID=UPI001C09DCFD|nr:DUF4238 domain-containing protein [Tritonibacter mobilis]MBU3033635.1 DUF4238 domain-containing protein [Tritonibacter mobilis]WHQ84388.1 DUF4238 domain-containing protein [Tritonibacter mobilis]
MSSSSSGNDPKDHHYVPAFYLREWESPKFGDKLIEFRRLDTPRGKVLGEKEVSARATGFQKDLYSISTSDPMIKDRSFEKGFLSDLDNRASQVLKHLLSDARVLDESFREQWAQFVVAQMRRSPEEVAASERGYQYAWERPPPELEEWYRQVWVPGLPKTLAEITKDTPKHELQKMQQDSLKDAVRDGLVVRCVRGLNWRTRRLKRAKYSLLTSDRPVFCNNRLSHPDGFLFVPLSPEVVFFAQPQGARAHPIFETGSDNKVVRFCNQIVVGQAHQYVWAADKQQVSFVTRRIGHDRKKSFNEIAIEAYRELLAQGSS